MDHSGQIVFRGLTTEYQGPGSKTVQPAGASARVDFCLMSDQIPEDILNKLRAHLGAEGLIRAAGMFCAGGERGREERLASALRRQSNAFLIRRLLRREEHAPR